MGFATLYPSYELGAVGDLTNFKPSWLRQIGDTSEARFGVSTSNDYRTTFFKANPELEGKVVVHHAVEQGVLKRFPGVVNESEMHSLENLRGIPNDLNSMLHLSSLRAEWNQFYKPFMANGTMPTKIQLLQKATELDAKYGDQFIPPH